MLLTSLKAAAIDDLLLGNAGIAAYPPGATFGPRLHYDFEFLWVMEGDARARFDDRVIERVAP